MSVLRVTLRLFQITLLLAVLLSIAVGVLYMNEDVREQFFHHLLKDASYHIQKLPLLKQEHHTKFDPAKNRQWLLVKRPEGRVSKDCFELKVVDKPTIEKGQVLLKNTHFSFDPTQKGWMSQDTYKKATPLGSPVEALVVATVVESQNPSYKVGDVVTYLGSWQDYSIPREENEMTPMKLPKSVPPYIAMTMLTDLTAIGGMLRVGRIQYGDKVLVSGAAGATGSIAGQVAKLLGASLVVGIAGGETKKKLLLSHFNFDQSIDYKSEDLKSRISQIFTPQGGIDVYFDNVGGETLNIALGNISHGARVVVCGAISQYDNHWLDMQSDLSNYFNLVLKEAKMEGFFVTQYQYELGVLLRYVYWQATGQLKHYISLQKNFDNLPDTFIGLFAGNNIGKLVLENDV